PPRAPRLPRLSRHYVGALNDGLEKIHSNPLAAPSQADQAAPRSLACHAVLGLIPWSGVLPDIGLRSSAMAESKTILVVDDDQELSDGLRIVLERQGHRVIQARDGQQGKQMVYQHHPDLVILDMMMPRMGGYPVLEHFKAKADAPPIIMITANEGSRHKAYAEYLGVVDYIRKPFAMERLLES